MPSPNPARARRFPSWFEHDDPWASARMRQYAEIVAAERDLGDALSKALAALLADAASALTPIVGPAAAVTAADRLSWPGRVAAWAAALAKFVLNALRALFSKRYRAEIAHLPPDDRPADSTVDSTTESYVDKALRTLGDWPSYVLDAARTEAGRAGGPEEARKLLAELLRIDAPTRRTAAAIEQLERTAEDPAARPGVRREARRRAAALRRSTATSQDPRDFWWGPKVRTGARGLAVGALNAGSAAGAQAYSSASGETRYKQWWSMEDTRVRPAHAEAHREIRATGDFFRVGGVLMAHPGDPTAPPELTANCRCSLLILSAADVADATDATATRAGPGSSKKSEHSVRDPEERNTMATTRTAPPPAPAADPAGEPPVATVDGAAVQRWKGVLAPLDVPSGDGRMLAAPPDGQPDVRTMPLPLLYQTTTAPGHDQSVIVGRIDRAWIEGNALRGEGVFNLASDTAIDVVRDIDNGFLRWVSVRLDKATYSYRVYRDGKLVDPAEVETALAADDDALDGLDHVEVADPWRLMSATLLAEPAFQEAVIVLEHDDEGQDAGVNGGGADTDVDEPTGMHAVEGADTAAITGPAAEAVEAGGDPEGTEEEEEYGKRKPPFPPKSTKGKDSKDSEKDEDENLPPWLRKNKKGTASVVAAAVGDMSLPISDRGAGWDGPGARSRLAEAEKLAQGCLYKHTSGDADAASSYKLPFADVTGGNLKIVPKGVFAAAAAVSGARGGVSIPDSDVSAIKSKLTTLYARMAKQFNDPNLTAPWDKDNSGSSAIAAAATTTTTTTDTNAAGLLAEPFIGEELEAMRTYWSNTGEDGPYPPRVVTAAAHSTPWAEQVAAAVPLEPPADWFADPQLTGPTKVRVSDEGRVYGYIAAWNSTHAALPGVKPPRNPDPTYARFHRHPVRTNDGEKIKTGPLATGGHADVATSDLWAVMQHYDDPRYVVADVVCGEDQYGIWVSGALRPGVSAFQVLLLDRYSISGDWRNQELVAACTVSVPGFHLADDASVVALAASAGGDRPVLADPTPRSRTDEDGDVVALVAAGVIRPRREDHVSARVNVSVDTSAVAREMLAALRALSLAEPTAAAEPAVPAESAAPAVAAQRLNEYRTRMDDLRRDRLRRRVHASVPAGKVT